jgi:hypothetical protein
MKWGGTGNEIVRVVGYSEEGRMSGGSYDYTYEKVERFAEALERGERFDGVTTDAPNCLARLGFAAHLRKVAEAMKAIEWEDSYDCSPPHAINAIHAVTGV